MKKFLSICLAVVLMGATCLFTTAGERKIAKAENKTIDMYLIAGQSNAAGYSSAPSLPTGEFANVLYAGQTDRVMATGVAKSEFMTYETYQTPVKAGLGTNQYNIGPEYGMAKKFTSQYSASHQAFIFKTAAGSTPLHDYESNGAKAYGNWYPRSLWEENYTPNLEAGNTTPTGVMYSLFLENFKKVYNDLVAHGYTPVVKGMAWMQGEEDMGIGLTYNGRSYKDTLETFITDIRNDLATITKDYGLTEMPFVIGKIATSFSEWNNPGALQINEMQQALADEMTNVATVETSDLVIVDEEGNTLGTDKFHFNTADAEKLGERFGEKLLTMSVTNHDRAVVECKNGSAEIAYDEAAGKITLSNIQADTGYKLSTITLVGVNGKDVILYPAGNTTLENNQLVVNVSDYPTLIRFRFVVNFVAQKYLLSIDNDKTLGEVFTRPTALEQPVGTKVTVTVKPKGENTVKKVTFNGAELTATENEKYEITIVAGENLLKVEYNEAAQQPNKPVTPTDDAARGDKGCFGSLASTLPYVVFSLGALWVCIKKRQ